MKVILLQDVKSQGKKGDVIEVSPGYAKNMLFPKKLAVEATGKNLNDLKLKKKHEDKVAQENLEAARVLAKELGDKVIQVSVKAGEGGRTFGSVSSKEIAEAAKTQFGLELDKKKMVMEEPIKTLGVHEVNLKLHPQVTALLRIQVNAE